jgi:hypothetical protein
LTRYGGLRIIPRPVEAGESNNRGIAQPGSASALGAEGRGFESLCPDHLTLKYSGKDSNAPVAQPDRAPAF